jgi:O-antigen/teichoic acid export membrane protein
MKKNKFQVIIYSVSAIISFVSANLLIGKFGIYGAVYSYVIAMFIHCCMYFIYFEYELKKLER